MLGSVLIFLMIDIGWLLPTSLDPKRWSKVTILGFVLSLPILILVIWAENKVAQWIANRIDDKMNTYLDSWEVAERGDAGENLVYKELQKLLDAEQFQIYRNLVLPGVKSDLDIVVVGPEGIILFEVKNYKKTKVSYTSSASYYKSKDDRWVKISPDLRETVSWRAGKLEKYLAEKGVDNIKVRKVILYVNPDSVEIKEYGGNSSRVYLIQGLNMLQDFLSSSSPANNFTLELCSKVNSYLKGLDLKL